MGIGILFEKYDFSNNVQKRMS